MSSSLAQMSEFSEWADSVAHVVVPTGEEMEFPFASIDTVCRYKTQYGVVAGCAIAECVIFLAVLMMISKKWKSALFISYISSFVLYLVQNSLAIRALLSDGGSVTNLLLFAPVSRTDINFTVAQYFFTTLVVINLVVILMLQVFAAYKSVASSRIRLLAYIISSLACLQTVICWIGNFVQLSVSSLRQESSYESLFLDSTWPSFVVTCMVCSLMLTARLWAVCRGRQKLGLQKLDPIKIILIVALQNSIIPPVMILIFNYSNISDAFGYASVAVSIAFSPIGYIWAQFNIQRGKQTDWSIQNEAFAWLPPSTPSSSQYSAEPPSTIFDQHSDIETKSPSGITHKISKVNF